MPAEIFATQESQQDYAFLVEAEYPMTFQIGLLGTDGFVIASDQKSTFFSKSEGGRWDSATRKIVVGKDLICAYSQDDFGLKVATELAQLSLPATHNWADIHRLLTDCANRAWKTHVPKKRDGSPGTNVTPRVILGSLDACPERLWLVDVAESSTVRPQCDKCYGGDMTNGAVFFGSHFYRNDRLRPVNELAFLAAHSVLMAHELNKQFVDGLEMYVCSGPPSGRWEGRLLNDPEIQQLRDDSMAADETLREMLMRPRSTILETS